VLAKNPCRIKKAGAERPEERSIASLAQLYNLAEAVPQRYRAMVLLAGLAGLRIGELLGLTRTDVDLLHASVTVKQQRVRLDSGEVRTAAPKTAAGRRTVAIPASLVPELDRHLATYTSAEPDALVFTGAAGAAVDRTNFRQRVWLPATRATDLSGLRFHDLRHTAATLAALTGASTKELMARLGHATPRAALIYQHATEDRDRALADALEMLIQDASVTPIDRQSPARSGTQRAQTEISASRKTADRSGK
jgi:integrase